MAGDGTSKGGLRLFYTRRKRFRDENDTDGRRGENDTGGAREISGVASGHSGGQMSSMDGATVSREGDAIPVTSTKNSTVGVEGLTIRVGGEMIVDGIFDGEKMDGGEECSGVDGAIIGGKVGDKVIVGVDVERGSDITNAPIGDDQGIVVDAGGEDNVGIGDSERALDEDNEDGPLDDIAVDWDEVPTVSGEGLGLGTGDEIGERTRQGLE